MGLEVIMDIVNTLKINRNLNYQKFQSKICNTNYEILGVKVPILRKIASNLLKEYEYQEILNNLSDDYFETVLLQGLIIGKCHTTYEEKINLINYFLPKIDNWAICDIFCSELKFIKNNEEKFLKYLWSIKNNSQEYYQRFIIVILLNYYINDTYLEIVLNYLLSVKSSYYYVKMAISWCYSIALVKYFDKTLEFLSKNKENIDKWTFNKAMQKGIESFRISEINKNKLKNLKY